MIYYEAERTHPKGGIYYQNNENLRFRQHLHNSFEWIYVCEGEVEVTADDRKFFVRTGESILIFPNQIHQAKTRETSRTFLCIFQNGLIEEFYRAVKGKIAESPVFSVSESLVTRLRQAENTRYLLKSCLYEMIAEFDSRCGGYRQQSGKSAEHIGQILTFIAAHHAEPITMRDAAREIGYDYHYLSNLLQKNLHTTFRRLLNEYRVSHAESLLPAGGETIASVAGECGYDSICSFNRNFKAITGMTPTEYRKKQER